MTKSSTPVCEFCNEPITDPNEITYNKITGRAAHRECFFEKYPDSRPLEFKE